MIYFNARKALSALWKLFRGKKQNVLRGRIDSCDYDVDQLLLGTLLFALVFFLFPTLAAYYFFFSIVRLLITVVQAVLFCAVFFINCFPFFDVFVHVLSPQGKHGNLGGFWFEVLSDPQPIALPQPSPIVSPKSSPRSIPTVIPPTVVSPPKSVSASVERFMSSRAGTEGFSTIFSAPVELR
jgi:phosphatidylinositol glycan class Q protein